MTEPVAVFESALARSVLAKRLARLAEYMLRARDQGHDGRYYPSDTDIEDVLAAAAVVSTARVNVHIIQAREHPADWLFPVEEWHHNRRWSFKTSP